jgi:hypothetical protein
VASDELASDELTPNELTSDELTKARDRADDLTDGVFSGFLSSEGNCFAGHGLDLAHAKTGSHHAGSCRQHTSTKDSTALVGWRRLNERVSSRQLGKEALNLVGRPFLEQKLQNDTDGFLGSRLINADVGNQTSDQLVYTPPFGPWLTIVWGGKEGRNRGPEDAFTNMARRCILASVPNGGNAGEFWNIYDMSQT